MPVFTLFRLESADSARVRAPGLPVAPRHALFLALTVALLLAAPLAADGPEDFAALEERFAALQEEKGAEDAHTEMRPQFEAFARAHAGTESGLDAELWLLRMHWWKRAAGQMQKLATPHAHRLIEEYGTSPKLKRIAEFQYLFTDQQFDSICEALTAATPHIEVKAACLYARAKKLSRRSPETARALFAELKEEYGDIQFRYITYGAIAEAHLNPHDENTLGIGKVAPDIVGVDVAGQPMLLSDYRGKVVVLDFWGDW